MEAGRARSLAVSRFMEAGIESPFLEADLLLEWATGLSRASLHAHPERPLAQRACRQFLEAIQRRCTREPLQHITGETGFYGLSFETGPGCLVPRPETEMVVEAALESFQGGPFVDWGTGSGCIAGAILENRPGSFCFALESEARAIQIAWKNFRNLGQLSRVLLWHGHDPWKAPVKRGSVDLVTSNPPYIPDPRIPSLMPEVRFFDPPEALSGGADGMDAYSTLLPWAEYVLAGDGTIVLEMGDKEQVEKVLEMTGPAFRCDNVLPDHSGLARVLVLKRERV